MAIKERSLYQCSHAIVQGSKSVGPRFNAVHSRWNCMIECTAGRKFPDGTNYYHLANGKRLEFTVCQECPDFDSMGPPVPDGERGWTNMQVPGPALGLIKSLDLGPRVFNCLRRDGIETIAQLEDRAKGDYSMTSALIMIRNLGQKGLMEIEAKLIKFHKENASKAS